MPGVKTDVKVLPWAAVVTIRLVSAAIPVMAAGGSV